MKTINPINTKQEELSSILKKAINRIRILDTADEKISLLGEVVNITDKGVAKRLRKAIPKMSEVEKGRFIRDIEDSGSIYVSIKELSEVPDMVETLYKTFDWL